MPESVAEVALLALAAVFCGAALSKAARPARWSAALAAYPLAPRLRRAALIGVPVAEAAVVALALAGAGRAAAVVALVLLVLFTAAILSARGAGEPLPCGCFGGTERRDPWLLVARNGALALLAASVLTAERDVEALGALAGDAGAVLPVALTLAGAAILLWAVRSTRSAFRRWGDA